MEPRYTEQPNHHGKRYISKNVKDVKYNNTKYSLICTANKRPSIQSAVRSNFYLCILIVNKNVSNPGYVGCQGEDNLKTVEQEKYRIA